MPPDSAEMQADRAPSARPKDRLRTLGSLDGRTTGARTAQHLAAAFKRALGDRYSPAMKPLIESAAMAAAIAADLQARMLAGDASVSVNDVVRAVNTARLLRLDLDLPAQPEKPKPKRHADVVAAILAGRPAPGGQDALHAAPGPETALDPKASPTGTVRVAEGMPP
jgi:hypothetical protein